MIPENEPRLTAEQLSDEGCFRLIEAICVDAAKEYVLARIAYKKNPTDAETVRHYELSRKFFLSDYFRALTNLDGKAILERLNEMIRRGRISTCTLFSARH